MNRRQRRQEVATRLFAHTQTTRTVPGMVLGFGGGDLLLGGVLLRNHRGPERARVWSEALTYLAALGAIRGLAVEDCWYREQGLEDADLPIDQDPRASEALLVVDGNRQRAIAHVVPYRRDDRGQLDFGVGLAVDRGLAEPLVTAVSRVLRLTVPGRALSLYPSMLEGVGHQILTPAQLAAGGTP